MSSASRRRRARLVRSPAWNRAPWCSAPGEHLRESCASAISSANSTRSVAVSSLPAKWWTRADSAASVATSASGSSAARTANAGSSSAIASSIRPSVQSARLMLGRRAGGSCGVPFGLEELPRLVERARAPSRARRLRPASVPARSSSAARSTGSCAIRAAWSNARRASCVAASAAARSPARWSHSRALASICCASSALSSAGTRRGSARRSPRRSRPARSRPRGKVLRRPQVLGLAVVARERLVGDPLDERLQEAVLPALGRPGVGLERETSLRTRPASSGADVCFGSPESAATPVTRERLAEHRGVAEQRRSSGSSPSSRAAISAWSVSGRRERRSSRRAVLVALRARAARGRAACARSRRRTAGCRRRGRESAPRSSSGRPGTSPVEQRVDRLAGERLEEERAEAPRLAPQPGWRSASSGRASVITKIGRFRDHSSRYSTNSTSAGVRPLDVLEDQDDGALLGHALEEQPPAGEEVLAVGGASGR